MIWIGVLIATVALLFAWIYNRLIRGKNRVDTAWSDINVQLQRRHDLIPNIVKSVNTYAAYERATQEAVTQLRTQAIDLSKRSGGHVSNLKNLDALSDVQSQLSQGLQRLLAVAESYPDLKADQNFQQLQIELVETENLLQFARRYYNGSVRDLNTLIESVPSNVVAAWFNFLPRGFFQKSSDQAGEVPKISMGSEQ